MEGKGRAVERSTITCNAKTRHDKYMEMYHEKNQTKTSKTGHKQNMQKQNTTVYIENTCNERAIAGNSEKANDTHNKERPRASSKTPSMRPYPEATQSKSTSILPKMQDELQHSVQ